MRTLLRIPERQSWNEQWQASEAALADAAWKDRRKGGFVKWSAMMRYQASLTISRRIVDRWRVSVGICVSWNLRFESWSNRPWHRADAEVQRSRCTAAYIAENIGYVYRRARVSIDDALLSQPNAVNRRCTEFQWSAIVLVLTTITTLKIEWKWWHTLNFSATLTPRVSEREQNQI